MLRTAEVTSGTKKEKGMRHYHMADMFLVGEVTVWAMRTNIQKLCIMNIIERVNPNTSWLKYRNITFNTRLCIAAMDITTYKYLSRKLPDRFRLEIGPIKSYEEPDCYTVYNVGDTVRYALSLASKGPRQYDQDTRDYYVKYRIVGIPSYTEKPFCYKKDWYESFVCECVIPKGSHYYEGYENGILKCLLSDCIVVQKIVESRK